MHLNLNICDKITINIPLDWLFHLIENNVQGQVVYATQLTGFQEDQNVEEDHCHL